MVYHSWFTFVGVYCFFAYAVQDQWRLAQIQPHRPLTNCDTNNRCRVDVELNQRCHYLKGLFKNVVSLPNEKRFEEQQHSYWDASQADLQPHCRISPTSTQQLADIVKTLYRVKTPFAVKGGGHSTIPGASNTAGGVTLDLSSLAEIVLTPDRSFIEVGSGSRWRGVYRALDRNGLYVNGARTGSVGVGGFLLGGGISISSSMHGWSCDSIDSIELITGNGSVIHANLTHHSDLFSHLKGSGNILGIATKFRLVTYQPQRLEIAFISYAQEFLQAITSAVQNYNIGAENDVHTSLALSVSLERETGRMIVVLMLSKFGDLTTSPSLKPFLDLPSIAKSVQIMTPGQLAADLDLNNPGGFRQQRSTLTVGNDALLVLEIIQKAVTLFGSSTYLEDPYYRPGTLIQPLTLPHLHHSAQTGNLNLLGLQNAREPLILISFEVRWSLPRLDHIYTALMETVLQACERLAQEKSQLHSFRYINYASADQDVFENLRLHRKLDRLRELRAEYDPDLFFAKHMSQPFDIYMG